MQDSVPNYMQIFLSHNAGDKEIARRIGTNLTLVGSEVWFDEWEVRAGDSLPGKIGEGLRAFDTFLLTWSENAERSDWVRAELETALVRAIEEESVRIIVVRLDDTPVPAMLRPLKYLTLSDEGDIPELVHEIMGFKGERERLKAMQEAFDDLYVEVEYFHGYGAMIACPRCGADVKSIEQWSYTDPRRDDLYAGARCRECGWEDGGEI